MVNIRSEMKSTAEDKVSIFESVMKIYVRLYRYVLLGLLKMKTMKALQKVYVHLQLKFVFGINNEELPYLDATTIFIVSK